MNILDKIDIDALTAKFMNSMATPVDTISWDLKTGATGVTTDEGFTTLDIIKVTEPATEEGAAPKEKVDFQLKVNPFEFLSFGIPAYATRTPMSKVQVGDMIVNGKNISFVVGKTPTRVKVLNANRNGTQTTMNPPINMALGDEKGFMVVKSLMNMGSGLTQLLSTIAMAAEYLSDEGDEWREVIGMIVAFSTMGGNNNPVVALPVVLKVLPSIMLKVGYKGDMDNLKNILESISKVTFLASFMPGVYKAFTKNYVPEGVPLAQALPIGGMTAVGTWVNNIKASMQPPVEGEPFAPMVPGAGLLSLLGPILTAVVAYKTLTNKSEALLDYGTDDDDDDTPPKRKSSGAKKAVTKRKNMRE